MKSARLMLGFLLGATFVRGQSSASTSLPAGGLEVAVMAGATTDQKEKTFGLVTQLELTAAFRKNWGAYVAYTRTPRFSRADPAAQQQHEIFSFGVQRQLLYVPLGPRFSAFPYLLAGYGLHSSELITRDIAGTYSPESFRSEQALAWGAGVRVMHAANSLWGIRIEYRAFTPLRAKYDYGAQHMLTMGIIVRIAPH